MDFLEFYCFVELHQNMFIFSCFYVFNFLENRCFFQIFEMHLLIFWNLMCFFLFFVKCVFWIFAITFFYSVNCSLFSEQSVNVGCLHWESPGLKIFIDRKYKEPGSLSVLPTEMCKFQKPRIPQKQIIDISNKLYSIFGW